MEDRGLSQGHCCVCHLALSRYPQAPCLSATCSQIRSFVSLAPGGPETLALSPPPSPSPPPTLLSVPPLCPPSVRRRWRGSRQQAWPRAGSHQTGRLAASGSLAVTTPTRSPPARPPVPPGGRRAAGTRGLVHVDNGHTHDRLVAERAQVNEARVHELVEGLQDHGVHRLGLEVQALEGWAEGSRGPVSGLVCSTLPGGQSPSLGVGELAWLEGAGLTPRKGGAGLRSQLTETPDSASITDTLSGYRERKSGPAGGQSCSGTQGHICGSQTSCYPVHGTGLNLLTYKALCASVLNVATHLILQRPKEACIIIIILFDT